jgi:glycosyltransferase involved in cell wall biosynthesis
VRIPRVEKRNIIVSLGRFVNTDRKNLTQQLEAFPQFLSRVGEDWSLYMIGFCAGLPQDRNYVDGLRKLAQNLPVKFVVNAERREILRHLSEAKLFWHTTGLSNGEFTAPRYMEHFGIATVEAMMGGCVPLVPACGGQPEIVEHRVSGFLCNNLAELIYLSTYIAKDNYLWAHMSQRALQRSKLFRPEVFEQRLRLCVSRCLEPYKDEYSNIEPSS